MKIMKNVKITHLQLDLVTQRVQPPFGLNDRNIPGLATATSGSRKKSAYTFAHLKRVPENHRRRDWGGWVIRNDVITWETQRGRGDLRRLT